VIRILFVSLWFLDVCMYYIYVYIYIWYVVVLDWVKGRMGNGDGETGRHRRFSPIT